MIDQKSKCETFARLHQQADAFLIPNPWDVGSARLLQGIGFTALATTSSGLAYTLGRSDGQVTLEEKLAHCTALAAHTDVPINADFENGFADDPATVAANLRRLIATGVAGGSIEDFSRDSRTLYDFNQALERVQAAAEVVAGLDFPFQLTARAENLLRGVDDLDDTIRRLQAFEAAGAQVLYAPGIRTLEQLSTITAELKRPFNVLAPPLRGATVAQLAAAGAQRISVGGALNWLAVAPVITAGRQMLEAGRFDWTADIAPPGDVKKLIG
ncbi:MAG: isocitrate lyase/phosphoenolpyruvate mutase family protein [Burkholderiaceae bacterium]